MAWLFYSGRGSPAPGVGPPRLLDRARGRDDAEIGVGFVVLLDGVEVVEVVHHQAVALLEALRRRVAEEIQPLEARAVAEMEPRHRIDGPARRGLGAQEIISRGRQPRLSPRLGGRSFCEPFGLFGEPEKLAVLGPDAGRLGAFELAGEPAGKARRRRERHEAPEVRDLAA